MTIAEIQAKSESWNMRVIGHHDLNGHGDGMQLLKKGRYVYVAHLGTSPMALSIVDVADPSDPRKAQSKAAFVAIARLDRIKGDFQHDVRQHTAGAPVHFQGVVQKMLRELGDLGVGESGVRFADREQPVVVLGVPDREGIIANDVTAFAVAILHADDDDIEGGEGFLQLEPRLAATARRVEAEAVLGDEALIPRAARGMERGLDLRGGRGAVDDDALEVWRKLQLLQVPAAGFERFAQQAGPVMPEDVEDDILYGDV